MNLSCGFCALICSYDPLRDTSSPSPQPLFELRLEILLYEQCYEFRVAIWISAFLVTFLVTFRGYVRASTFGFNW